jgi:hypothetical protein
MLRDPQHERKILNDLKPCVRPEPRRRTPTEFFNNLLKLDSRSLPAREPLHSYITTVKKKKFPGTTVKSVAPPLDFKHHRELGKPVKRYLA